MTQVAVGRAHHRADQPIRTGPTVRAVLITAIAAVVVSIWVFRVESLANLRKDLFWAAHSIVIMSFILRRFGLAWLYRHQSQKTPLAEPPSAEIIISAYNEPGIAETPSACFNVEYPDDLLRLVVDDRTIPWNASAASLQRARS